MVKKKSKTKKPNESAFLKYRQLQNENCKMNSKQGHKTNNKLLYKINFYASLL